MTVLHIAGDETLIRLDSGAVLTLAVGSRRTAAAFFRHEPPTEAEMENAIMAVEDELMRVRSLIPEGTSLETTDAAVRGIALLGGAAAAGTIVFSVEAVERLFDRLAAVMLGRPASVDGIPASREFAATLLILREFMHHLKFAEVTVRPAAG
ncbi:MAG: hypothetical protein V4757_12370 [Pseudomonadota bacterium]